jgi:peptidoglycan/LPS O-acetylase OafA/YrhL
MIVMALGLTWWSGLYGSGNGMAFVPARLMMCLGLIALLPRLSRSRLSFAPINRIGRDSLFFYLWHPLVMGVILATGASATTSLLLSIPILMLASHLFATRTTIRLLLGNTPPSRPRADPRDSSEVAVQPA